VLKYMGLTDRFRTGSTLLKNSLRFVSHEKDLVIYPILNAITYILILAFMFTAVFGTLLGLESLGIDLEEESPILVEAGAYGFLFIYYALAATATTFFSSGLVYCATERFRGNHASIIDGLRRSWGSKNVIIKYGLLSALVGVILKIIERKFKNAGKIVSTLGGLAWNIATFFVVPVIMYSGDQSLRQVVKDSGLTFKTLWGETASARLGLEFVLIVYLIILSIPFGLLFVILPSMALPIAVVFISIILLSLAFFQVSVGVIKSSLYMYAMTGKMPKEFKGINKEDLVERE